MKKHTEEQPIDDLFARKLGNMSLQPNPHGFARLKARMTEKEQATRIVFWPNSTTLRYAAAAACLLIVSLFGWYNWPLLMRMNNKAQVAENKSKAIANTGSNRDISKAHLHKSVLPSSEDSFAKYKETQVAQVIKSTGAVRYVPKKRQIQVDHIASYAVALPESTASLEKANPNVERNSANFTDIDKTRTTDAVPAEQLTTGKMTGKNVATSEYVLEVTIAEPASLIAARQITKMATNNEVSADTDDKPEKETRSGGLWKQIKRFKQGEVFARRDNSNDDKSLLGRAYSGLKQSFEKDKSTKQ